MEEIIQNTDLLTEKEIEIIKLISEGKRDKEIAPKFGITLGGIRSNLRLLIAKTNTKNRSHLVGWAYREGILKRG